MFNLARDRSARAQTYTVSIPAPVKGWNTKATLADMDPQEAVIMMNWFPDSDQISVRKGYTSHATGLGAPVETLMTYSGGSGQTLFAAAASNIYDVTSSGAVGAASLTGMSNARYQYVNFGNAGGTYLWICNGADAPRYWDGSSWTTTSITGMTGQPIWVTSHKRRLFIGADDSLAFYYLGTEAIDGAATRFDLSPLANLGGKIMGMATWSRDGGAGMDDLAVFVTSEGQAIIYQGDDPSSASSWALVGVFRIGKPIGRRFWAKFGADVVLITESGFLPLSSIISIDVAASNEVALSDKINPTINQAVRSYGNLNGWQAFVYPRGLWFLVNVPIVGNTTSEQYVFNTITGAACRFTNMNALSWALLDDDPYFGAGDGVVYRADYGRSDNGNNIEADLKPAFSYFGRKGRQKLFKMARPIFASTGTFSAAFDMNFDYEDAIPSSTPTFIGQGNELVWNQGNWNEKTWGGESLVKSWRSITGIGYTGAMRIRVSTNSVSISLRAIDYTFELGGIT